MNRVAKTPNVSKRMESGRQYYELTSVSLDLILREGAVIVVLENDVHHLQLAFPADIPRVRADADQLRQVLANLLSNAVKYSPKGDQVTTGAHQEGVEITAWAADQGVDILAEAIPQPFEKFFFVDNKDTKTIGSTSLSLALMKQIVEVNGGRIWSPGVGGTFFFTLPVAVPLSSTKAQEHALL
jgi:signal transduction histidine kinase